VTASIEFLGNDTCVSDLQHRRVNSAGSARPVED